MSLFGDKARARAAAIAAGVPVMPGLDRAVTRREAQEFFAQHPDGIMIKALAGGGGRGTRAVTDSEQPEALFHRCQSEAEAAFGIADVYVEAFMAKLAMSRCRS